jgi:hypothetical protein
VAEGSATDPSPKAASAQPVVAGVAHASGKAQRGLIVATKEDQDTAGDGRRPLMGELAERWMPDDIAFVVD